MTRLLNPEVVQARQTCLGEIIWDEVRCGEPAEEGSQFCLLHICKILDCPEHTAASWAGEQPGEIGFGLCRTHLSAGPDGIRGLPIRDYKGRTPEFIGTKQERRDNSAIQETLDRMSDEDLLRVWETLRDYDPTEYYDEEAGITMDDWAQAVYSEKSARGL